MRQCIEIPKHIGEMTIPIIVDQVVLDDLSYRIRCLEGADVAARDAVASEVIIASYSERDRRHVLGAEQAFRDAADRLISERPASRQEPA